jgi:hypothetical protein
VKINWIFGGLDRSWMPSQDCVTLSRAVRPEIPYSRVTFKTWNAKSLLDMGNL